MLPAGHMAGGLLAGEIVVSVLEIHGPCRGICLALASMAGAAPDLDVVPYMIRRKSLKNRRKISGTIYGQATPFPFSLDWPGSILLLGLAFRSRSSACMRSPVRCWRGNPPLAGHPVSGGWHHVGLAIQQKDLWDRRADAHGRAWFDCYSARSGSREDLLLALICVVLDIEGVF